MYSETELKLHLYCFVMGVVGSGANSCKIVKKIWRDSVWEDPIFMFYGTKHIANKNIQKKSMIEKFYSIY